MVDLTEIDPAIINAVIKDMKDSRGQLGSNCLDLLRGKEPMLPGAVRKGIKKVAEYLDQHYKDLMLSKDQGETTLSESADNSGEDDPQ